jgi:hypothetical protein
MKRTLILILTLFATTCLCSARAIIVTSAADSGPGTLRSALQSARWGDVITFDPAAFPPANPTTIYPHTELPPIYCGNLMIDASNAGVIIDGFDVPGDWNNGLQIYSDHNTVMGLQIVSFKGSGIAACSASYNTIGGDRSLGSGPIGQGNLSSGNGIGIDLCDFGEDNVVEGNIIGTDVTQTADWGNERSGIWIEDGVSGTTVGPDNVVANNRMGIEVSGSRAAANTIAGNCFFGNRESAICLRDGANGEPQIPMLAAVEQEEGHVAGWACSDCTVEVYSGASGNHLGYLGTCQADPTGWFELDFDKALTDATIVAIATDASGNTSEFSYSQVLSQLLQEGNVSRPVEMAARPSAELADNRIGVHFFNLWNPERYVEVFPRQVLETSVIVGEGLKHAILAVNDPDWDRVDWSRPEMKISTEHEAFFRELYESGVTLRYRLNFWNKAEHSSWEDLPVPRFKSEHEILAYLDFVAFIARELGEYIEYYELWGEPSLLDCPNTIEVEEYIALAHRAARSIRAEDPSAKIVIGAVDYTLFDNAREYLFTLLRSDLMPITDGISWHGMYGTSPEYDFHRDYYYEYPSLVRDIVETATANGFRGQFFCDELTWRTSETWGGVWWDELTKPDWPMAYSSETKAAKYLARGLLMNLGLDVAASQHGHYTDQAPLIRVLTNLCTVMAGHKAINMPMEIDIKTDGPVATCTFRYPNGNRMLAVWTDGIAQDEDPGVPATITFPGLVAGSASGTDVLYGFEQDLVFEVSEDDTIIRDLLVKDYPILIRLSDVTMELEYEETVGDGYHQLGDVDVVPSSAGGGSDRDGDGVPDDEDFCPDWPGSAETSGC